MNPSAPAVIYVGPSLSPQIVSSIAPAADVRPPVRRGDLYRDRNAGYSLFLIIDGMFAQSEAASPREVIEIAQDGAIVVGASSMGALRAAECWPVGVRGIGRVYRAFRRGILESDDEVAVVMNSATFESMSVALVNIRFALRKAVRGGYLSAQTASAIIEVATRLLYAERQWENILKLAGVGDKSGELLRLLASYDVKKEDALSAVSYVTRLLGDQKLITSPRSKAALVPLNREMMDSNFGWSIEEVRIELTEWLFGTGRYMRYVWPLVAGHHAFGSALNDGNPSKSRESLCAVLAECLPATDLFRTQLCEEVEFNGELEAEIARMYAAKKLAFDARQIGVLANPDIRARVRDEIAIAHDAYNWESLLENVFDKCLCGAIPFSWIDRSCEEIALARSYVLRKRTDAR